MNILPLLLSLGVQVVGLVEVGPGVCQYDLMYEGVVESVELPCPVQD